MVWGFSFFGTLWPETAGKGYFVFFLTMSGSLSFIQEWFSQAISRPLTFEAGIAQVHASPELHREAGTRIRSANGVNGFDRLAIYNRQYWFRLIACMQETYPCALHVLGLKNFNEWIMKFLERHPSDTPYLAELDLKFAGFMEKNFPGESRGTVVEAIHYDRAHDRAFTAPESGPLVGNHPGSRFQISPHATPLWLHGDFTSYRNLCHDDEALTENIPLPPRENGVMIFRKGNRVYEKEIPRAAYLVLDSLRTPKTLAEAFTALDPDLTPETASVLEKNLTHWFKEWVEWGWVSSPDTL